MIALFIIFYVLGIWLFYVKMKIKPTPVNVAVAAVIGVVAVGAIVILWQFSSPTSGRLVINRYTIELVPQVKGPIEKIHAEPNVPLEKDKDILFEIQKDPYEMAVRQLTGVLDAAEKTVDQLSAGVDVASAAIAEAEAGMEAAKSEVVAAEASERELPGTIGKVKLNQLEQKFAGSQATLKKAIAGERQAKAALESAKSSVESAKAGLDKAEFDLTQCVVYAPADGFVTNWQVREGTMAVPLPLAPIGTFIDTSEAAVVATFGQNVAKNIKPGDRAEFALKSNPGQVFGGTVVSVIEASGEGQMLTSGRMATTSQINSNGQFAVKMKLDDANVEKTLAMGTAGMTAIYTDTGAPFHVISKVTVRIKAWMYYLLPF